MSYTEMCLHSFLTEEAEQQQSHNDQVFGTEHFEVVWLGFFFELYSLFDITMAFIPNFLPEKQRHTDMTNII